ncbi:imidazole glycerol phosphate synthase subunit HisF [Salsipaludibacter albus]|uniref:imidazole glycerol phosphate synthase subunit HisF n=1 Tax=Salsipaludibacter albus TaxID=2849650 RepID=UPI001EE48DA5|nr:imidazole glycerol phosphate synthase subunit HisF [Salsipaludibacter albus]
MTVAARVIACLDVTGGRVVKGVNFVDLRDAGDPVALAAAYDRAGIDELVFLDITASSDERDTMVDVVSRVADQVSIPFAVGGGLRSVDDARTMLHAGADKVAFNTAAVRRPELVAEAAASVGSQSVVASIDARRVTPDAPDEVRAAATSGFHLTTRGGRVAEAIDLVDWCRRMQELGAGEILLNSMDRDGTKAGFDVEMTRAVTDVVTIPVIASGGAGSAEHLAEAIVEADASAVLAASIFHFGEVGVDEAKDAMATAGIPVRRT